MTTIVRFEYGRLGNQLFQYSALRSLGPKRLVLAGFNELFTTFSNVQGRQVRKIGRKRLRRIDGLLTDEKSIIGRRVSKISQSGTNEAELVSAGGCCYYCPQATFFESNAHTQYALALQFQAAVKLEVEDFRRRSNLWDREVLFVHARGGDFYTWPSAENPGVVPTEWLIAQAKALIDSARQDASVVVIGDDPEAKRRIAAELGAVISTMSSSCDLYLMATSVAGVLSASDFSWWGSAFAAALGQNRGPFIAPMYWLDHRKGIWTTEGWPKSSQHLTFAHV